MMKHLERALDNQNQWWKYLVIVLIGFIGANFIGALPLGIVIAIKIAQSGGTLTPNSANLLDFASYGIDPNLGLFLMILPFIVGLFSVIILLKPLHKRSWREVINGTETVRWSRFFYSFAAWSVLLAGYFITSYLADPGNYQINFNPGTFIVLMIISFIFIPFQSTYEEVLFRGYLSQGIAAWTRNRWLVLIIPALVFGLMHSFNPEVKEFGFWYTMPQYWAFGLTFGLITILDDGIECAMGVHAANNILSSVLVTSKSSVLQTPALLMQNKVEPVQETLILVLLSILLVLWLGRKYQWNYSVMRKRVVGNSTL